MKVTHCTTRIVRVRLGGAPPDAMSYLPTHSWPDVAPESSTIALSMSSEGVTFGARDGTACLYLALDQTRLQPRLLVRLQTFGEQHFYGLGEGGSQFDRLGAVRRFWNFQVNRGQGADMAIPLLLSNAGYGVFFDSTMAATLEPGDAGDGAWLEYRSSASGLDLYFIGGRDMREVLGDVATLLGQATMPPRWALGYLQSSRHFSDASEVRGLAKQFRAKRLPCDALIFLSSYGAAKGWNRGVGHLEVEPRLFDESGGTFAAFHDQNFRVITHEYPVLHEASPLFAEADSAGYLLDTAYPRLAPPNPGAAVYKDGQRLIDFSQPAARAWWWQAHRHLRELGVAGWWLDGGEGPPAGAQLAAGSGEALHNRYDLLRQQAFAEGEAQDYPATRPFLLCRSGGPGMQRFGAAPWSGDINATFASLELQVRTGLNVGMSGVPHWGTDTGGFYRVGVNDAELFVRWFQFSAFCSIFRGHGFVWREHLPWSNGEMVEQICRRYLELRSRLMPYNYTLAWQARTLGLPMMRPLVLNYPHDPAVWDLGTQYLWGDDILVAPVIRKGATQWTIYLPSGVWHDFWTDCVHWGPGGVTVPAPLDTLPLFVRSGAIIPMGPVKQFDDEPVGDELELLIYPDGSSSFSLYEDDGISTGYLRGDYRLTAIECIDDGDSCLCRITPQVQVSGRSWTFRIHTVRAALSVVVDGSSGARWWHEGSFLLVRLPSVPATVRVVWDDRTS